MGTLAVELECWRMGWHLRQHGLEDGIRTEEEVVLFVKVVVVTVVAVKVVLLDCCAAREDEACLVGVDCSANCNGGCKGSKAWSRWCCCGLATTTTMVREPELAA